MFLPGAARAERGVLNPRFRQYSRTIILQRRRLVKKTRDIFRRAAGRKNERTRSRAARPCAGDGRISARVLVGTSAAARKTRRGRRGPLLQHLPAPGHSPSPLRCACAKAYSPFSVGKTGETLLYIRAACIPTVLFALLFKYLAPSLVDGAYLPLGFAVTAVLIFLSEKYAPAQNRFLSVQNEHINRRFSRDSRTPPAYREAARP